MYIPIINHTIRIDQEEDFAIKSIETNKKSNPVDVIVTSKPQTKDENYLAEQEFREKLANNQKIFDILFELLEKAKAETYLDDIWKILITIPFNKARVSVIESQKFLSDGCEIAFPLKCYRKLLYGLMIIDQLTQQKFIKANWFEQFVVKNGVIHLLKIFIEIT